MGYQARGPFDGGGQGTLWEWNGIDVSQFGPPVVVSSNNPGTFTGTASLTPGLTSPQPNGMQLALTGSGAGVSGVHYVVFPILAPLPTSFQVEINSISVIPSSINEGNGFYVWGEPSVSYGYLWQPRFRKGRLDNGTLNLGVTNGPSTFAAAFQTLRIEGATQADWTHGTVIYSEIPQSLAQTQILSQTVRNTFGSNDGDWGITAGNPPVSWAGQPANTFGLCLMSTGGGGGIPTWNIGSIKIRGL